MGGSWLQLDNSRSCSFLGIDWRRVHQIDDGYDRERDQWKYGSHSHLSRRGNGRDVDVSDGSVGESDGGNDGRRSRWDDGSQVWC